jgi:hypothetical protein
MGRRSKMPDHTVPISQSKYSAKSNAIAIIQVRGDVFVSKALQFDEVDGLSSILSEGEQPLSIRNISRIVPEINQYKDDAGLILAAYTALRRGQPPLW